MITAGVGGRLVVYRTTYLVVLAGTGAAAAAGAASRGKLPQDACHPSTTPRLYIIFFTNMYVCM